MTHDVFDLSSRRELFVDHKLIDSFQQTELRLHEPRPMETAIVVDRPWEGAFNGGCCVFQHQGLFRMYYRALTTHSGPRLCYAESADGIHWTKPELGLVQIDGDCANNVIVADTPNFDIFLDTRPGVAADECIKMTRYSVEGESLTPYFAGKGTKAIHLLASGDGLTFRELGSEPIVTCDLPNAFDSHNIFFWSHVEQQYLCYFRIMDPLRTVARMCSPDLQHWSEPVVMAYGDTPREELYTNSTIPYFRAPHIYLALPARFMPGRRVLTDAQLADMHVASYGEHVYYNDCSDAAFMSTRAGTTHYERTFMEAFLRPGPEPGNWVSRTNYPLHGIIQTAPEEISLFASRHYAQPSWHLRRFTLRTDGFVSVHAPYSGGEMITRPCVFQGRELEINYATGAAGGLRVELQDGAGLALPGYALNDCDPVIGDEIERCVSWAGNGDVSHLAGTSIRLRFAMHDADLYALRFVP